jgi:hypothetical protein
MAGGRHELGELVIGDRIRVDAEAADGDPVRRGLRRVVVVRAHPELAAGHPDEARLARRARQVLHAAQY